MARLKEKYRNEVVPAMVEMQGYKNVMQVPRLEKIVLNIGLGEALKDAKAIESAEKDLAAISGQHPVTTRAKKSIAAFRLRIGMPIGLTVTLRAAVCMISMTGWSMPSYPVYANFRAFPVAPLMVGGAILWALKSSSPSPSWTMKR